MKTKQFPDEHTAVAISEWLESTGTPGAGIALLKRGEEPVLCCAGIQDQESRKPVTQETIFEAASLGKPLFACLVMQLAGKKLIDLDAPLSDYLSAAWVPDEPRLPQITARRVLSHSTGLPNWFRDSAPRQLVFSPGERFGYSGEGFLYLQRVVEEITGQTLDDLARSRIFDPLEMQRSTYFCPDVLHDEMALGHDTDGCPLPKWKPWPNAGTSLHTSVADYARFLHWFISGGEGILPAGASGMLPWQTPIDADTAWGLGWGLKRAAGENIFWQWGDNDGWKHFAGGTVERGMGVLVLTNGERGCHVWKEVLRHTLDPQDTIFNWLSALP